MVSQRMKRRFTEIAIAWRAGGEISGCSTGCYAWSRVACVSTPYKIVTLTKILLSRRLLNLSIAFAAKSSALNVMISSYVVKKQSDKIFILWIFYLDFCWLLSCKSKYSYSEYFVNPFVIELPLWYFNFNQCLCCLFLLLSWYRATKYSYSEYFV